jgi:hypothetical protein
MYPDEYQRCMQACHTIASLSPSNEMRSYARESDMSVINQQLANDVSCLSVNTLDQSPGTSASTSPSPVQQQQHQLCHASSHQQQQQQQFAFAYGNPPMMNSIYSNSNPTLSTEFVAQTTPVKARRNTISERPRVSTFPSNNVMNFPPVPPAYLQLSSQDIPNANSFFMHSPHQPLHNIHATPLTIHQPPQRSLMRSHLRGPSQSCTDLRAMSRAHKKMPPLPQQPQTPSPQQSPQQQQFIGNAYTQYRSPESIMSNSTVSTAPYGSFHGAGSTSSRGSHSISSNLPYGRIPGMGNDMLPRTIPIAPPASSQSSGYQRQNNNNGSHKMRIRKSTSSLGLSNIRQQHQHQQQQQQQYQLYQQQQYIQQQMISANSNGNSMGGFTSESSTSPIPNYEAPQHSRRHTVPYGENSLENMLDINSNPHRSYQPSLIDYNDLSLNIKLPELMDTPMDEDYSIYDVPPIGDDIQRTEGQLH